MLLIMFKLELFLPLRTLKTVKNNLNWFLSQEFKDFTGFISWDLYLRSKMPEFKNFRSTCHPFSINDLNKPAAEQDKTSEGMHLLLNSGM